jgi:hypothetical protein
MIHILSNIQMGDYDSVWKCVSINEGNLKTVATSDLRLFASLVTVHEMAHWHQLSGTTLGHFLSFLSYNRRYTVQNFLRGIRERCPPMSVTKPLFPWATRMEPIIQDKEFRSLAKAFRNDITASKLAFQYLNAEIPVSRQRDSWHDINQALFSTYDMYIESTRQDFSIDEPEIFVRMNREFWDKEMNYHIPVLSDNQLFPGFRDLAECGARLSELKYYILAKKAFSSIGRDFILDDSYLLQKKYFVPLHYLRMFFAVDELSLPVIDILSLLIFVALNPPVVPHFSYCYKDSISVKDIHPGSRFIKACQAIQNLYGTLEKAHQSRPRTVVGEICEMMAWPAPDALSEDLAVVFADLFERNKHFFEETGFFENQALTDMGLWLLYFNRASELRARYPDFFINSANYYVDPKLLAINRDIHSKLHCPITYNCMEKKYKIQVGGIRLDAYGTEKKEDEFILQDTKEKTDRLQQVAINFLKDGVFSYLDEQLLYKDGPFDLSVFESIDAPNSLVRDLLHLYEQTTGIPLSDTNSQFDM